MAKAKHTCHYCNMPTTTSIQSRAIRRRRFICSARPCWIGYWRDVDAAQAKREGGS